MKNISKKILFTTLALGLVMVSCNKEENLTTEESQITGVSAKASLKTLPNSGLNPNRITFKQKGLSTKDFSIGSSLINAVDPSECGDTPFRGVLAKYDDLLFNSFLSVYDGNIDGYFLVFYDYFAINQITAYFGFKNADYFGANGEYTQYMKQSTRSLENFWDMHDLVQVRGQHTATLEDPDLLRFIYENFSDASEAEINYLLGLAAQYNAASDQIPENPFFASDGFASFDGKIVIGDGLVSMLAEVGIDPKVVWSSILAHEWGHQVQFLNYGVFAYPIPPFIDTPESTRMTELEADFFTGYYLTHKRGATYNWKRVEGFLQAFFEIGDCYFGSNGHHGTPIQRMASAEMGYELAKSAQKNGKILSQQAVHDAFINAFDEIINGSSGPNIQ
ncbi:MAG: hypothetical protein MUO53_13485 [Maribacter sp.]|nr:hypothetical protein [Maribacter sp.]